MNNKARDDGGDLPIPDHLVEHLPAKDYYHDLLDSEARVERLRGHVVGLIGASLVVKVHPSDAVESLHEQDDDVGQKEKNSICFHLR